MRELSPSPAKTTTPNSHRLGDAGNTLNLLTLGYALAGAARTGAATGGRAGGDGGGPTVREAAAVCLVRLALVPAAHLCLRGALGGLGWFGAEGGGAMGLVLLLEAAMPCALSVQARRPH